MGKTVDATFDGEVFRPDELVDPEPNTKVRLQLITKEKKKTRKPFSFFEYGRSVSIDAPPHFSSNLDAYLYGGKSFDNE